MQGFVATCVVVLLSVLVHTATGFNARLQPISLSTSFAASSSPATSRFPSAAGLPPQRMARHSLYSGASTRNLSMQSPASSSTAVAQQAQPTSVADTVIVGSGPTGLAGALMLARRGYKDIHVYDRLPEPPAVDSKDWGDGRNYNVGLSGRGQKALKDLQVWDEVEAWTVDVVGRIDWSPGSDDPKITISKPVKGYTTKIIQRDRLASCLLKVLRERYPEVQVSFGTACVGMDLDAIDSANEGSEEGPARSGVVSLAPVDGGAPPASVKARLILGADGVRSEVRKRMTEYNSEIQVQKFEDDNVRVYKTISIRPPSGSLPGRDETDLNLSVRTEDELIMEALPTKEGFLIGVLLFRPGDERVLGANTPEAAKQFFEKEFPMLVPFIDEADYAGFAGQKVSSLPSFQSCGPVLHYEDKAVLLGDAIHCVKPYFGLGVNSAFEDVTVLDECLEETGDDLSAALPLFSARRGEQAVALVSMQRGLDRPGIGSFVFFILPIILDSIFNKAFPALFKPALQTCMQQAGTEFTEIRTRKRIDRAMQVAVIGGIFAGLFSAGGSAISAVTTALSQ